MDIKGGFMRFIKKFTLCLSALALIAFTDFDAQASSTDKNYSVDNLEWDDAGDKIMARWDKGEDKSSYKIQLYKGSKKIGSLITLHGDSYDFTRAITDAGTGTYHFTVYPGKVNAAQRADETKQSPDYSIDYDLLRYFRSKLPAKDTNIDNKPKIQSPLHPWKQAGKKWQFIQEDDTLARSKWILHNSKWYYFDSSMYMLTGWQFINSKWYYFSTDGEMLTNWRFIDNNWYLLGKDGDMQTGWQNYNEKWYYLDTTSGHMLKNTTTPDNYRVDANGVYIAD